MYSRKFHICNAFGIPVYVDISFTFLLLIVVASGGTLPQGVSAAILLAVSIVLHELGHSLTARMFGYRTNDITISLLGGCASLIALPRKAWQEFLTAIAGPAVSIALSFIGMCVFWSMVSAGGFLDVVGLVVGDSLSTFGIDLEWGGDIFVRDAVRPLLEKVHYLATMNLMLALFNLLPGFPMDGGRVFRSAMRSFMSRVKATFVAMWVGRILAILLGLSGVFVMFHGGSWGGLRILIAWMIWKEGYREYLLALVEESRWDYTARVSPPPYGGDEDDTEVRRGR